MTWLKKFFYPDYVKPILLLQIGIHHEVGDKRAY